MKTTQFIGLIALAAVITFGFAACETPVDSPKDKTLSGEVTISPSADVTTGTELTASYGGTETVTLSWQWKKSGGNVGTNANKFTPLEAGSYTVTVKAQGYKSKDSPAVTVTGETLAAVTGLTAEYNPTTAIFPDTSWQTIKDGLTVTATYSDGTTKTLDAGDYELSGTLAEGESTVTVTYRDKTTTFKVTVGAPHEHVWSEWETVTPAACTTAGLKKHTCSVVTPSHDETEPIAIDPDAHDWGNTYGVKTAPTETANGAEAITCTRNASHFKGNTDRTLWATGTAGLEYELIPDGEENEGTYRVKKGTTTEVVHIPAYHRPDATSEYKLVTEITGFFNSSDPNTAKNLTTVTFAAESQLTTIVGMAFYNCSSLASISIPASLTTIGNQAFTNCSSLTSISIPASVTSIGSTVFLNCDSLASITVDPANETFASQDNIVYNKAKTAMIVVPPGISGSITIPANITAIGERLFFNSKITAVTFAADSQLESIGKEAFVNCSNLTSIDIPASVTNIGENAFFGCRSLASINVNSANQNYASESGILYNKAKTAIILIPQQVSGEVTLPATLTAIGDAALQGCTEITNVIISEGVTSIGYRAFYECTSLTSISLPASLTTIGNQAFGECRALTSITVAVGNTNFASQDGILYNAAKTALVIVPLAISGGVSIPNSVTSIGVAMFEYCGKLTAVTIPSSVTSIGDRAFSGCSSLTSVTFQGTIAASSFQYHPDIPTFPGDLRDKFYATNTTDGTPGTYIVTGGDQYVPVWTLQP